MRKFRFKKRLKKTNILLITIFLLALFGCIFFNYFSKRLSPIIFKYAEDETKKFSNLIINDATSKMIVNRISSDDIFDVLYDKNNNIKSIDFNTVKMNSYLSLATRCIQNDMKNLEKGNIYKMSSIDEISKVYNKNDLKKGIIFLISSGYLFDSPLLSSLGPKIPVKISLSGDVISYLSTDVKEYGINNSLIKVYVNFKVYENIILPFYNKTVLMSAKVPIAMKMITGKIPQYYGFNSKIS